MQDPLSYTIIRKTPEAARSLAFSILERIFQPNEDRILGRTQNNSTVLNKTTAPAITSTAFISNSRTLVPMRMRTG